jgi:hypothetical protein
MKNAHWKLIIVPVATFIILLTFITIYDVYPQEEAVWSPSYTCRGLQFDLGCDDAEVSWYESEKCTYMCFGYTTSTSNFDWIPHSWETFFFEIPQTWPVLLTATIASAGFVLVLERRKDRDTTAS